MRDCALYFLTRYAPPSSCFAYLSLLSSGVCYLSSSTTRTSSMSSPACCQRSCQAQWQALSHLLPGLMAILSSSPRKLQLQVLPIANLTSCPRINLMAATMPCTTTLPLSATPSRTVPTQHDRQIYTRMLQTASETMSEREHIFRTRIASSSTSRSNDKTHHFNLAQRTDISIRLLTCQFPSISTVVGNPRPIQTWQLILRTSVRMAARHPAQIAPTWPRVWLWLPHQALKDL